jgi:membrane-anchored protein YejM (alkaline phosphatase superfamily)
MFLRSEKSLILPCVVIYSLFLVVILINAKVFGLYRFHLNSMVLNLITGGSSMQILSIPLSTGLVVLIGLAVIVTAEYWFALKLFNHFHHRQHSTARLWLSAAAIMLSGQLFYAYSDARGDRQVTSMLRYIPWAQPLTAKRKLRAMGINVAQDDTKHPGKQINSSLNYPKHPLQCNQQDVKQYNTLIVVIDSLRFDMLNAVNMPNTYQLRDTSWVFNDHYSTGNATRFGFFGLMYGLPGSYWFSMLGEKKGSVLIDTLVAQEQQLIISASAAWSAPEFDRTVFAEVTEQITSGQTIRARDPGDKRHIDSIVTDYLLDKITARNKAIPFFGLLFLDAPHSFTRDAGVAAPFQPSLKVPDYLALDNDSDPTMFFNLYKNSVYYDDLLIAHIVDTLEQQHLLDDTVLIITSDHAQEFNDTGLNFWGHNGNFSRYQTRVPLLIRWPGESAKVINYRTSHEDIVPTLMQRLLGCQNPVSDYSTGQNLFSETYRSRSLLLESWSRRALMTDDRIYVFESYGDTRIYDHDYRETTDETTDKASILKVMKIMGKFLQ